MPWFRLIYITIERFITKPRSRSIIYAVLYDTPHETILIITILSPPPILSTIFYHQVHVLESATLDMTKTNIALKKENQHIKTEHEILYNKNVDCSNELRTLLHELDEVKNELNEERTKKKDNNNTSNDNNNNKHNNNGGLHHHTMAATALVRASVTAGHQRASTHHIHVLTETEKLRLRHKNKNGPNHGHNNTDTDRLRLKNKNGHDHTNNHTNNQNEKEKEGRGENEECQAHHHHHHHENRDRDRDRDRDGELELAHFSPYKNKKKFKDDIDISGGLLKSEQYQIEAKAAEERENKLKDQVS